MGLILSAAVVYATIVRAWVFVCSSTEAPLHFTFLQNMLCRYSEKSHIERNHTNWVQIPNASAIKDHSSCSWAPRVYWELPKFTGSPRNQTYQEACTEITNIIGRQKGCSAHLASLLRGEGTTRLGSCWPMTNVPLTWRSDSAPLGARTSRKSVWRAAYGNAAAWTPSNPS